MKFITCSDAQMLKQLPALQTDICTINQLQLTSTSVACGILLLLAALSFFKFRQRCYRTLLTFHNLRSAIAVSLLVINTLELARAYLPLSQQFFTTANGLSAQGVGDSGGPVSDNRNSFGDKNNYTDERVDNNSPLYTPSKLILVPGSHTTWNAGLAIVLTLVLMTFHRIIEVKSTVEFLYMSVAVSVYISFVRFYKLSENTLEHNSIFELEAFIQSSSGLCLFCLGITDGYTIYKERFKPSESRKADDEERKIGYQHTCSTFYSKIIFWWLTPLLWQGYREPLEQEDLGHMREEDSARAFYDQFLIIYKAASARKKYPSLWLCYLKSSWQMFTLGGLLKLFGDLSALVGPISIHQIVLYIERIYEQQSTAAATGITSVSVKGQQMLEQQFHKTFRQIGNGTGSLSTTLNPFDMQQQQQSSSVAPTFEEIIKIYYPTWMDLLSNGWAIAWFVLVASLAQGALSQASTHILNMTGIRIKTSLQGLIYRKTLLLSSSCLATTQIINECSNENGGGGDGSNQESKHGQSENQNSSNGDVKEPNSISCVNDVGAITNLMSEDTLNIMSFFWIAHYVWAIPLKIGVVMYLLYMRLGVSAIIGSFVCILTMTPLQFLIGKAMSNNSEMVAKCADERLKRTHDVFWGIKLIKLNAWEKVFAEKIRSARNMELKFLNKDSFYWTLMTFLTHVSSVLITFVTLAVYVNMGGSDSSSITNVILPTIANVSSNGNKMSSANRSHNHTMSKVHSSVGMGVGGVFPIEFTASRLFSALALFNQLTVPLLIFPITVPIIISAIVSTRRLERFLREREVQKEFEGIRHMARILSKSDASLDMYEGDETILAVTCPSLPPTPPPLPPLVIPDTKLRLSCNQPLLPSPSSSPLPSPLPSPQPTPSPEMSTENLIKHNNNRSNASDVKLLEMDYATVRGDLPSVRRASHDKLAGPNDCHTFPKKRKDLIRNSRIERVRSKHLKLSTTSLQFQAADNLAVFIKGAVFSWDNCNTLLRIDGLEIPKGRLTVVVGKNGSGKSSLLGALLMEMQQISGEIVWNKFSTIAYVPQVPWLLNASIRENILFGESFRPKRYDMVLESCALKPDIELMPDGDMTIIGERGINLSGGQRQRVAIARSLYSSANVVIMDDPLSSLDNEVARHVFEKSIKKMLLKANRTVVLVTQRLQLIHNADYIVVMKDGCMQAAGSFKDIEGKYPKIVERWKSIITTAEEKEKISPGRTARERWKLFKNITKIGLQRPHSVVENEPISTSLPSAAYSQPKKRSSVYGSRHLIYDMPIPIDECQNDDVIIRRRSAGTGGTTTGRRAAHSLELKRSTSMHKHEILRVHSLQPDLQSRIYERTPVMRNISSPGSFLDSTRRRSGSGGTTTDIDLKSSKTGFQQFLHRMSSRKSNKPTPTARIHRPVSATNSILSISEESHPSLDEATETSSCTWVEDEEESSVQELNAESLSEAAIAGDEKLLVLDEERKYGEIPMQIYMLYLKSAGLPIVFVFFATALIWQCLRVYTDVWLQRWTELSSPATTESPLTNVHEVTYYFRTYAIISSICILMALITTPAGQIAGCNARRLLHDKLLQSILTKSLHFFQITPLGRIMNRFSNDMAIIDKKIAATSQRLLQFTLLCLCAILINVSITPWFALLTLPICAAYYIIQKFYRCSSRELQRIENITNSPVISHFSETVQGVVTIRAYSQEARFTETLFKRLEANTIAFTILNTSNRWLGISLDYLGAVIVFVAIVTALLAATISSSSSSYTNNGNNNPTSIPDAEARTHGPTPSLVGLAINYTLLVPIYLNWVVKLLADMEMYVGSVERVAYYAEPQDKANGSPRDPPVSDDDDGHVISSSKCCGDEVIYKSVPISWPQKGDITFENVSLRYEGQKENVITDLTLKIPAGQRVGICGRTGSGKSSLALSLFGVLKTISGRILIDDVDITQIHTEEIRSRLSIIPQDVHLFHATIRENLDPRGYYSDLDLWKCLELAQLKDVIVNAMPQGLDTKIGDGGRNLSAGHRQLFCLARAILRGSVCLLLDEATSSLDTTTERALMDAAHNAFQGRTILTIAHRLSTILDYDRIIVLENGRIVEDGTPKALQSNTSGQFFALLNSGRVSSSAVAEPATNDCK